VERRIYAIALLAAVAAVSLASVARAQGRELWPGVSFEQTVQPTPNGPVVIDVMIGPRPGGATTLDTLLSNNALTGRETVTGMEKRFSANATYAGVNGDFSNFSSGLPSGGMVQQGQILAQPSDTRSTVGVTSDGTLAVQRVGFTATWQGSGLAHTLNGLNKVPPANGVALFTDAWGASTPTFTDATSAVLFPFPRTAPGIDLQAPVQTLLVGAASTAIPPGGAVLVARGSAAAQLAAEAAVGATVTARLTLKPDWPTLVTAMGGGPQIVRNSAPVFRANEVFLPSQLNPRAPRTGIGQLRDGRIIMVAVDGRQPGWSVGMTNFELAQAMTRLGAVTAMALDAGGSTTMAYDGQLLNRPSDGRERPIANALVFAYTGVFLPDPVPAVSPNGDGVDDTQTLAYKLVRPSSVTVTLTAPDGSTPVTQSVQQEPGRYAVPFPVATGETPAEGTWKLSATAVDELGQQTEMSRTFLVDNTLGFLQTSVPRLFLPPGGRELVISWKQTRLARVVVTVETKAGDVVRTLALRRYDAGDQQVVWNGLDRRKKRVKGGVYRARVSATSTLGKVQLTRTFTVRQIAGP
jgi:hypothetical protein